MKVLLPLTGTKDLAKVVGSIWGQDKSRLVCFVGYNPSELLISAIDTLISQGYCHIMVVTNMESDTCHCQREGCICRQIRDKLLPDNVFIFTEKQHPDLAKILPKLGADAIWVVNTEHPQKNEIIQRISS